jgi:hypothetical protein
MDIKDKIEQYDEMIVSLVQQNLQLINDIENCDPDMLKPRADILKIAVENAHILHKTLFNLNVDAPPQNNAPKPISSKQACESIKNIMKELSAGVPDDGLKTRDIEIEDIIILTKDGTIRHFEA